MKTVNKDEFKAFDRALVDEFGDIENESEDGRVTAVLDTGGYNVCIYTLFLDDVRVGQSVYRHPLDCNGQKIVGVEVEKSYLIDEDAVAERRYCDILALDN